MELVMVKAIILIELNGGRLYGGRLYGGRLKSMVNSMMNREVKCKGYGDWIKRQYLSSSLSVEIQALAYFSSFVFKRILDHSSKPSIYFHSVSRNFPVS